MSARISPSAGGVCSPCRWRMRYSISSSRGKFQFRVNLSRIASRLALLAPVNLRRRRSNFAASGISVPDGDTTGESCRRCGGGRFSRNVRTMIPGNDPSTTLTISPDPQTNYEIRQLNKWKLLANPRLFFRQNRSIQRIICYTLVSETVLPSNTIYFSVPFSCHEGTSDIISVTHLPIGLKLFAYDPKPETILHSAINFHDFHF